MENAMAGAGTSSVVEETNSSANDAREDCQPVMWQTIDDIVAAVRETIHKQRRPCTTLRVQFNHDFTFQQAAEQIPYWKTLGISDLYASPYLKAVKGSRHGYDIVDHGALNPELGSAADFETFVATLHRHGMGHICDFVPNHMGVGSDENGWWQDVLENGPASRFASFFDIDWNPLKPDLDGKVLLPVLGEQFGQVLENQQLTLGFESGAFFVQYFGRRFPIAPKTFSRILGHRLDELLARMPADDPHLLEYQSILTAIGHLPHRSETDPARQDERNREKEVIKRRLQRVCDECPAITEWIRENVEIFNGRPGDSRSFDLLDDLLMDQAYRLSFWRVAADEINYRRFFDVNELAAVCMESPPVFAQAHVLVFRLLEQGKLDGLRIDHADGLFDPTAYLWQIQEERFIELCRREFECRFSRPDTKLEHGECREASAETLVESRSGTPAAVSVWQELEPALRKEFVNLREADAGSEILQPLYLVVEKILERNERLPENWPVHGSTGYEFLNDVNGVFVEETSARAMETIYSKFIGQKLAFSELTYQAKLLIMRASMSSELHVLGHHLDRISERTRWTRDFTRHGLIQALREVIACFPVYRTYTVDGRVFDVDRRYIEQAVARAQRRNPATSSAIFDFVRDVLLFRGRETLSDEEFRERQRFVGRFQQFTGPMMAKAVEDTAYYRFNRLVSLNEVGGDPERFGLSVDEFHRRNLERQARHPYGMLATSTHDTKRSEDVRARINVLSEMPDEWKRRVSQWTRWNKRKKAKNDGELIPARNDEYLLYQTLVGTWPFEPPRSDALKTYVVRIQQYMRKALREAKLYSSWIAPNEGYEQALDAFIEAILCDDPMSAFRSDFEPFARQIADCGMWNSLSQLLLKLGSPGVPDTYQGTELWDFSLVDPDNRREVDYSVRRKMLAELQAAFDHQSDGALLASELVARAPDGRIKMFVIAKALALRQQIPEAFTRGAYIPLESRGMGRSHICAFARQDQGHAVLVVVPRLMANLGEFSGAAPIGSQFWGDTSVALPADMVGLRWRNTFTNQACAASDGQTLAIHDVFSVFPVALLEAEMPAKGVSDGDFSNGGEERG